MSKRILCDACEREIIHNEYDDYEDVKIAEEIMESVGYPIEEYDICPDCAKWLNDKVRELVDNKMGIGGLEP